MAKSKLVEANEKIERAVVGGYKKIEEGVVGSFTKVTDKFVDSFLTKEGEAIEDAKKRLAAEQKVREESYLTDWNISDCRDYRRVDNGCRYDFF